jgi:hypothetical protein
LDRVKLIDHATGCAAMHTIASTQFRSALIASVASREQGDLIVRILVRSTLLAHTLRTKWHTAGNDEH